MTLVLLALAASTCKVAGLMPFSWRWVPIGGGGAVMCESESPHRPGLVLAGADLGGVLRSEDAGRHWQISNEGLLTKGDRGVAAFAWHPTDPNRVFMAAGECFGQPSGPYGGLFVSDDAGRSWRLVTRKLRFSGFGRYRQWGNVLKFGPDGALYAATAWDGLFRSPDQGRSFEHLGLKGNFLIGIEFHANDPKTIYAAALPTKSNKGAIFISRDGGRTWRKALEGLKIRSIAADPFTPGRIFAAIRDRGPIISDDFGQTWRPCTSGIDRFLKNLWTNAVFAHPRIPGRIYLACAERVKVIPQWWRFRHPDLFVSQNSAQTWRPCITRGIYPDRVDVAEYLTAVDASGWWRPAGWFAFNPMGFAAGAADRIYIHDWFGVWASDDAGSTWRHCMNGLATTVALAIAFSPTDKNTVYFGLADVNFLRSRDSGRSIEYFEGAFPQSRCRTIAAIAKNGGDILYSQAGRYLIRSDDAGQSWHRVGNPAPAEPWPIAPDPFNPSRLYCGRFVTDDEGRTWRNLPLPAGHWRIVPDPTNPGRLYAWRSSAVMVSQDGGRTFRDCTAGLPRVHAGKPKITALAILAPQGWVYTGHDVHGVWVSRDAGKSWHQLLDRAYIGGLDCASDGRTVAAAIWLPWFGQKLGRSPCILLSRDAGKSWRRIDAALGVTASANLLRLDPRQPGRIWLGTAGNGFFVGNFAE